MRNIVMVAMFALAAVGFMNASTQAVEIAQTQAVTPLVMVATR